MTTNSSFDGRLTAWLHETSEHRVPDHLVEVLMQTAASRQRPWWSSPERWLPMDLTTRANTLALPRLGRLVLVGLLILAIAAVAIIAIGSRPQRLPAPFGLAANGQILSWEDDYDIYVAEADGSGRRPLIAGPTQDSAGWYSHDGTRFAFLRTQNGIDYQLLMADADGSDVRPALDETLLEPAVEWSPQDDRVAIVHRVDDIKILSILDLPTRTLRQLPMPGLSVDSTVQWRPPGGDELVFTARPERFFSAGASIYAIRPDGTGLRTIVPERPEEWAFLAPALAPDGRTLAYWMYEAVPGQADPHARVHLVDMATNEDRQVVFDPANVEEAELRFSPDGRTGLILSATDTATLQLVTLEPIGPGPAIGPRLVGGEARLALTEGVNAGFSPDGKTVVLAVDYRSPTFIDIGTGASRTLVEAWGQLNSWQRLAP